MKFQTFKPIVYLILLILVVGAACGGPPTAEPTDVPVEQPAEKPTSPPEPTKEPTQETMPETSGAVSSIQDVQGAVIQIEAQGTFVDPEFGEYSGAGRGSGFIIDPSGIAVTNNHVVTGAALLKVWIGGDTSKTYNARILGVSECSDLAVIDIEGDGFPYLDWYDQPIKVGLDVYTAGFPLGDPEYTLTKGIVSKVSADGETNWASVDSVIMHDATINPGNSGGPLVDQDGKVVGINYAAYKSADQYFAIGPDVAIPVVNQLREGKDVDSIGINGFAFVNDDNTFSGIWVNSVKSGSLADKAGIAGGDILTDLEGFPIAMDGTMSSYCDIIRTHAQGDTVGVKVYRYQTAEDLEGQLNGDPLQVVATYGTDDGSETDDSGSTQATGEYYTVYDDTSAIALDVPVDWTAIDGGTWEATWGNQAFKAASVVATPDMSAYNDFRAPGVWFAASEDWGNLGGYVQLLDGVKGWYRDDYDCDFVERGDYGDNDPVFEGGYDIWEDCGAGNATVLVIAARPKNDPFAYLVLVQIQLLADTNPDVVDNIVNTFDRVGSLP
jgi:serine protease Do